MARPSLYDPKYCDMIIEYFDRPPYVEVKKTVMTSGGPIEMPVNEATDFPTLAGFARSIGVHRETLLNWAKEHDAFFDALKKAKNIQEDYIQTNGMKGLVNTPFVIFAAKNIIGWRNEPEEKKEDDESKHEKKWTTPEMMDLIKAARGEK